MASKKRDLKQRIESKIRINGFGCWEWKARKAGDYGRIVIDGISKEAHRVSYECFVGPIPKGKHIDHLCKNSRCVNPAHLEPVTSRENTLRGNGPTSLNAKKKKCHQGHAFDKSNTQITPQGWRKCRKCQNKHSLAHYNLLKAQRRGRKP